eukprot:1930200-Prymnesium_polylepis.1
MRVQHHAAARTEHGANVWRRVTAAALCTEQRAGVPFAQIGVPSAPRVLVDHPRASVAPTTLYATCEPPVRRSVGRS